MKKFLLATVVAISLATPALADYAAMAGGIDGFVYAEGYRTMEAARAAAVRRCRNAGYGSCNTTVAERSGWHYSGGVCDGMPYVGASPQGWWRADEIVEWKGAQDGNYNCTIIFHQ